MVGSKVLVVGNKFSWEATGAREDRPVGLSVLLWGSRCLMVKTAQCSSVSGAYASWACTSMGMHLTGGTAQKVGTNELDNRRVGHSG